MKMINRGMIVSLTVLFMAAGAFAQEGAMGSGMEKGMMGSGMMDSSVTKKGMMSSGMMGSGMMSSGMMKKCRGMMESRKKESGDIQALIDSRDKLELTDEQVTALKSIESSLKKKAIRQKADLQVAEIELGEILNEAGVKISSVESKLKQIEALRTEIRLGQIKAQLNVRDILSDEQRKEWKSVK